MIEVRKRPDQNELLARNESSIPNYDIIRLYVEDSPDGVKITNIEKDSPASNNNLKKGDYIQGVGRKTIITRQDYNEVINSYTEGDLIMLKIKRGRMITYLAFEI